MPYSNQEQTWVDKRGRTRQIPMRIICPSLSRSGTSSLRIALSNLGYTAYHGWSLLENPPDCVLWQEAMKAKFDGKGQLYTKEDFDAISHESDAIVDIPGSLFAEELIDAYPQAKVVMSTRNIDTWHASCLATIVPYFEPSLLNIILGYFDRAFGLYLPTFTLCMKYTFGNDFAANGKDIYREHCARVRQKMVDAHREADYLEFDVKDGWKPLCKFLGREVPSDAIGTPKPFPKVNDRATFGHVFDSILKRLFHRMLWTGLAGLMLVAAVALAWWK